MMAHGPERARVRFTPQFQPFNALKINPRLAVKAKIGSAGGLPSPPVEQITAPSWGLFLFELPSVVEDENPGRLMQRRSRE